MHRTFGHCYIDQLLTSLLVLAIISHHFLVMPPYKLQITHVYSYCLCIQRQLK